ncbi:MAG: alpha/beta hydrolase [Saprospiraceae bacterium]|nr:alpha/beta hydrolase [Saprospiraceae bacterium]
MKRTLNVVFVMLVFMIQASSQETIQKNAFEVSVEGEGQAIFYFPGFSIGGSIFQETIQQLDIKGQNHIFTFAGFDGLKPIDMPWYPTIKAEIKTYIQEQNLEHIIIIGHSMGGNLALDLAMDLPDKVSDLVIIDALPCMREVMMPGVPAEALQYESPYNQQVLDMKEEAFKGYANTMASNMTKDSVGMTKILDWILKADRKTYVYGYTDLLKIDARPGLEKIKANCLILVAPEPFGEAMVLKNINSQYQQLATKSVKVAPKSRHFIMYDNLPWMVNEINLHLNGAD